MSALDHPVDEQALLIDIAQPLADFTRDAATGWYLSASPRRVALAFQGAVEPENLRPGLRLAVRLSWQELQGKRWRHVQVLGLEYAHEPTPPMPDGSLQLNDRPVAETPLAFSDLLARAPRSDRAGGARGAVGRKALVAGEVTEAHSLTLPASAWRQIEQIGGGNRSEGVRRLLESQRDDEAPGGSDPD